jgi:predicted choloylglycine hydrolase
MTATTHLKSSRFSVSHCTSGIKVFSRLPQSLKILANDEKSFKSTLKKFLNHHSFYSMHEYYQYMEDEGVLQI